MGTSFASSLVPMTPSHIIRSFCCRSLELHTGSQSIHATVGDPIARCSLTPLPPLRSPEYKRQSILDLGLQCYHMQGQTFYGGENCSHQGRDGMAALGLGDRG